ncbi:MAG: YfbM family protein [Luteibacter jiangsuensis]
MSMIGHFERLSEQRANDLLADPGGLESLLEKQDPSVTSLDVDKAWYAIHFALTGQAWPDETPLAQAIFGGEPFGDDLGYGPPRLLAASKVRSVAQALAAIDPTEAVQELEIGSLDDEEIYPGSWSSDESASRDYIAYHLQRLRDFYSEAAAKNEAIILRIA